MKKNLLLYILLAVLIIMNGFFLYKHFGKSNKRGAKDRQPKNFIAKELQFDASQMAKYEVLDREHKDKKSSISEDLRSLKDDLFNRLSDATITADKIDSLATLIANKEKARDIETFNHFRAIQGICNEDQKVKFKSIIKGALHNRGPKDRQGPPSGKDGDRPPPRH